MIVKFHINRTSWRYLHIFRQGLACVATSLISISCGFTFGFTAVLLPQIKEDDSFPYDKEYDSWIASAAPLSMILGCLVSGSIMDTLGRKLSQMILLWPFIAGWLIHAFAYNVILILNARILTGFCTGIFTPLALVYLGEISDPKYRGIILLSVALMANFGVLLSHLFGGFLGWKLSSFIFSVPNLLAFVLLIFLKESPLWLLSKSKTTQGTDTFEWFRGKNETCQRELSAVLDKQKEKPSKMKFKEFIKIVFSGTFLKPFVTIVIVFATVQFSGINSFLFYAQDFMLKTFSGSIDPFLSMIVTDCIRTVSILIIFAISNRVSRRKSFLLCSLFTSLLLFGIVVYLNLSPSGFLWVPASFLILYIGFASITVSISWAFMAEIFPNSVRGLGSGISSASSFVLLSLVVKVIPSIVDDYGIVWMYTGNAVATLIGVFLLYFLLPETNGKTLQEIENEYDTKN